MEYVVHRTEGGPALQAAWDGEIWQKAETLEVAEFRPESSDHRPETRVRLLYDDAAVYGIFHVKDQYVRCVYTRYQSEVCRDSCVEFFVQPKPDKGYFNLEMNCGGTFLIYYITDPSHPDGKSEGCLELSREDGDMIGIYHSMPKVVDPEIAEKTDWVVEFRFPFALMSKHAGPLGEIPGAVWRANFYKCGNELSHPHWASWAPLEKTSFHLPHCFAPIRFED